MSGSDRVGSTAATRSEVEGTSARSLRRGTAGKGQGGTQVRLLGRRLAAALTAAGLAATAAGCGAADIDPILQVADPWEDVNRDVHAVNKAFDTALLRPLAVGYGAVAPGPVRYMVSNFVDHLETPRDFVNHVLTGELSAAARTVGRFTVNTVMGAGLLDPASDLGLEKEDADFGRTLAVYGVGEGVYYEAPFFGPTTARHTVGRSVDFLLNPLFFVSVVTFRQENLSAVDSVLYESLDSYASSRALYLQNRRSFLGDASTVAEEDPFDPFEESPQ